MQINKSDRNDAAGIARIMQTGWFKEVRPMTCRSNAPDPTLNLGVPITGHQGNVRLRSTQSSGTVDEEQLQEIPAETHEGNEAYRDEPDISVRIVCIPKHGTRG
jgi:hypothetical protein